MDLVIARPEGLYCPAGDFYIDPWRPVERSVITHAHGDHARTGNQHYLSSSASAGILRARLGQDIQLQTLDYGQRLTHHGVTLSFHPAGHVLGSAQVRLEYGGEVWVASGDYKVEPDGTCTPFEPVRCHTFITESTFGLPIYRWQPQAQIFAEINQWWAANIAAGKASVLFCYSFGKAQRILHGIDETLGPILSHGAVEPLNRVYRDAGVYLPPTIYAGDVKKATRSCARRWSLLRRQQAAVPGCGVSASSAMPLPAAGCACAEPGGGAASIAVSSFPITPIGPACCGRSTRPARNG